MNEKGSNFEWLQIEIISSWNSSLVFYLPNFICKYKDIFERELGG
jgi:hypothetical protein